MQGGLGDDEMYGQEGNDHLEGGAGNDIIRGGGSHDEIFGGIGNDKLYGNEGNDVLKGGEGDDILDGGSGHDVLIDTEGDNEFYDSGNYGSSNWIGGSGADKYFITGVTTSRRITIDNLTSNDTIFFKHAAYCKNWTSLSASVDIEPELAKYGEDLESGPWTVSIMKDRRKRIEGFVCNVENICVKVSLPTGRRC